ncbi:MAG TPA: hypothetical protein VMV23_07625 [Candidatus Nanopelagicaceae bacterium]|nr:hypothetical protein [Candidatus Nanopelagicaceae bacterium]
MPHRTLMSAGSGSTTPTLGGLGHNQYVVDFGQPARLAVLPDCIEDPDGAL